MFLTTNTSGDDVLNLFDGIVIGTKGMAVNINRSYSLIEIEKYSKRFNVYVNVNKLFSEDELMDLLIYLNEIQKMPVKGIIFSDMAVYQIINDKKKLIYNPHTLITSLADFNCFTDLYGVFVSPIINIDELKMFKDKKIKLFFLGYGKINLFYAKRKLLSNYAKQYMISNEELVNNFSLFLKEELRDDLYPIYETDEGTFIYTPYTYSCLDIIDEIKDIVDFFVLDFLFIDDYKTVIEFILKNEKIENTKEGFLRK